MEGKRTCPYCAETIAAEAVKCRWCGEGLQSRPAPPAPKPQPGLVSQDEEHLRLLAIGHYVLAALKAALGTIPLLYVALGVLFVAAPDSLFEKSGPGQGPPPFMGWLFIFFGGLFVMIGWTMAVLLFIAGRSIAKRKRHFYCLVVAGLSCLSIPFGTLLGIFTFVVLLRPSAKALFEPEPGPQP